MSVNYDTTDSKLDPTAGRPAQRLGRRLSANSWARRLNLAQFKARGSAYYSIDPDGRFVLAGRIGLGAEAGPALDDIPANWRFYSGGGGSVRGYAYDSLGPRNIFGVVGGRSLFEASAELRVKITDTIGIVPFFDAGNAFVSVFPNFSAPLYRRPASGCAIIRRSARSASTSPFPSSASPAAARWRSTSASGRPSDGEASQWKKASISPLPLRERGRG